MTAFGGSTPKAFVSWAHSDDAWRDTIARFVVALREFGIDADVDLFHAHDGSVDWATYGPNAIEHNDFVLLATSAAYKQRWDAPQLAIATTGTGAGAAREANVLVTVQLAVASLSRVSGGQRISPVWKRPTGRCRQTVARSSSTSMMVPCRPCR